MTDFTLQIEPRQTNGKHNKRLRRAGVMPAVLYGKNVPAVSLQLNMQEFVKVFRLAGTSSLVTLSGAGKTPVKVLMRQMKLDPVTLHPQHIDFYQINMKEKIRTEVPLEFVGASPAVEDLDGKLVHSLDSVEVECLPDDLVPHIEVDISSLAEFDQAIHVKDLVIPAGIEVLTDADLVITVVQAPISEEELEADLAAETSDAEAVAAVEVEEKGEGEIENATTTEGETQKIE